MFYFQDVKAHAKQFYKIQNLESCMSETRSKIAIYVILLELKIKIWHSNYFQNMRWFLKKTKFKNGEMNSKRSKIEFI